MNFDPAYLMVSIVFGSIAFGIFWYGFKQKKPLHLVSGVVITLGLYLFQEPILASVISCGLIALWYIVMKKMG